MVVVVVVVVEEEEAVLPLLHTADAATIPAAAAMGLAGFGLSSLGKQVRARGEAASKSLREFEKQVSTSIVVVLLLVLLPRLPIGTRRYHPALFSQT